MKRVGRSIKVSNDGEEKRREERERPAGHPHFLIGPYTMYILTGGYIIYIYIHRRRRRCHFSQTERANVVIKRLRYYNEKEGGKNEEEEEEEVNEENIYIGGL